MSVAKQLLIVGNSLGAGCITWDTTAALIGQSYINKAVSGWTVDNIQDSIVTWLDRYNPDEYVFIEIGGNDCRPADGFLWEFIPKLSSVIDTILGRNLKAVFGLITPRWPGDGYTNSIQRWNAEINKMLATKNADSVFIVAEYKKICDVNGPTEMYLDSAYTVDGIHPTIGGSKDTLARLWSHWGTAQKNWKTGKSGYPNYPIETWSRSTVSGTVSIVGNADTGSVRFPVSGGAIKTYIRAFDTIFHSQDTVIPWVEKAFVQDTHQFFQAKFENDSGSVLGPVFVRDTGLQEVVITKSMSATSDTIYDFTMTWQTATRPTIVYSGTPFVDTIEKAASHAVTSSGGGVDSFTISAALPTGLTLNATSGLISGTPTQITAATEYSVYAHNATGKDTAIISIATPGCLVSFAYGGNKKSYTVGAADSQVVTLGGCAPDSFNFITAPPSGVTINKTSGTVLWSGTGDYQEYAAYIIRGWSAAETDSFSLIDSIKIDTVQAVLCTLNVAAGSGGTVSPSGNQYYNYPDSVKIIATPATGYTFTKWTKSVGTINIRDSLNDTTYASTTDSLVTIGTVTGNFSKILYPITFADDGHGTCRSDTSVLYQDSLTISQTPDIGYTFSHWSVTAGTVSFNADSSKIEVTDTATLQANYDRITYVLTVLGNGVNGTTSPATDTIVDSGTVANISATAATGYDFAGWSLISGTATFNADSSEITLHSAATIGATFTPKQYTLTMVGAHSMVTFPAKGDSTGITYNSEIAISQNSELHWIFTYWSKSGGAEFNGDSTTVTITDNAIVTANHTIQQYPLNVGNDGNGTTTPAGDTLVDYNSAVPITATPDSGYRFKQWTTLSGVTAIADTLDATTTVTLAIDPAAIRADFELIPDSVANITSITPEQVGPGDTVTLAGTVFGSIPTVIVNTTTITSYISRDSIHATFRIPTLTNGTYNVIVQNNVYGTRDTITIEYLQPFISSVKPVWQKRGLTFKVRGYGFGTEQGDGVLRLGISSLLVAKTWTDTLVEDTIPASWSPRGTYNVILENNCGAKDTGSIRVLIPTITPMTP